MIGVLAFQGGFDRHAAMLRTIGSAVRLVRGPEDLNGLDGIVLPGGESTTIGMLMHRFGLLQPIAQMVRAGLPVLATCAGTILLAQEIEASDQLRLGVLGIRVERNAYGRQKESFETMLSVTVAATVTTIPAVFIRAPKIVACLEPVRVLAEFEGVPVLIQRGAVLAATFHPELTDNPLVHRLFQAIIAETTRQ